MSLLYNTHAAFVFLPPRSSHHMLTVWMLACFCRRPIWKWLARGSQRDYCQQWATRSQWREVFFLSAVWQESWVAWRIGMMIIQTLQCPLWGPLLHQKMDNVLLLTDQFITSWLHSLLLYANRCPCFANKMRTSVSFSSSMRSIWLVFTSLRSVYGFGLGFSLR